MALRPLWIAWQGLTIGLTPIYRAIQGLWPEDEEEDAPLIVFGSGGGGRKRSEPNRALERHRAEQERIRRHNEDMMALILAAVAEEYAL